MIRKRAPVAETNFHSISSQVLTQEDWNAVLCDAMRSTTKWASVYFVLLMIIGNYILFNLLVAILVEGFSSETVSLQQSCFLNLENLYKKITF